MPVAVFSLNQSVFIIYDSQTFENSNNNNIMDFSHPNKTSSSHLQSPVSKLAAGSAQIPNAINSMNSSHSNRGDDSLGYSGNEGYSSLETDISGFDSSYRSVVDSSMEVPASPTMPVPVINLQTEPDRHPEERTPQKQNMVSGVNCKYIYLKIQEIFKCIACHLCFFSVSYKISGGHLK